MNKSTLQSNKVNSLTLLAVIFIGCISYSEVYADNVRSIDDVNDCVDLARKNAISWESDSKLVWVTGDSNISSDGRNLCSPENLQFGWNYIFYAQKSDSYYSVSCCDGILGGNPTGKGFPKTPEFIPEGFIGTRAVVKVLKEIASEWKLSRCHSNQTLRMSDMNSEVDKIFPVSIPIWEIMMDCQDQGGFVFIDGRNGKILKSQRVNWKEGE